MMIDNDWLYSYTSYKLMRAFYTVATTKLYPLKEKSYPRFKSC